MANRAAARISTRLQAVPQTRRNKYYRAALVGLGVAVAFRLIPAAQLDSLDQALDVVSLGLGLGASGLAAANSKPEDQ